MTTTFNKVALMLLLVGFAFGAFNYVSQYTSQLNDVSAAGSCGSCGGNSGGGNSDNGDGRGSTWDYTPKYVKPVCALNINKEVVRAGDTYTMTWNVNKKNAPSVTVYINDQKVDPSGSATYTFKNTRLFEDFSLRAVTAGGECRAYDKVTKLVDKPVCTLNTNLNVAAKGQVYKLTWKVTPAQDTTVKINGTVVKASDSATYTFNGGGDDKKDTFTLTAENAGGKCTQTKAVTLKPEVQKVIPSCDLFTIGGQKTLNLQQGQQTRLRWATTNAKTVSIDNGIGNVAADNSDGRVITAPNQIGSRTYTLTATSKDGINRTCAVTLNVTKKPEPPKVVPDCKLFTINGSTNAVVEKGAKMTFRWQTERATKVTISGFGQMGLVNNTGGRVENAPGVGTHTYTLTATSKDGEIDSCVAKITVKEKDTPAPKDPTCQLDISKSYVYKGEAVKLFWTTTNTKEVGITMDGTSIGTVTNTTNQTGRSYTMPNALGTYTFKLTATSNEGKKVYCEKTVVVKEKDTPEPKYPKCDFFKVNDNEVRKGTKVTLSWDTTNANRVEINNGIGRVDTDGTREVEINGDTDFRLTAYGDDDRTDSCTVEVDIESSGGGGGGSPLPRCEFKASDRTIKAGDRVELSWETRYGRELTIYEGDEDDKEIYETDDDDDVEEGEITVRPRRDTTYTLVVERGSRDRKCEVDIEVEEDDVTVIDDRDQTPRVAGIALTQVPYTGFEAGPMLTLIFYALLALWGLFVAYHFVIRKKGSKLY